MSDTTVRIGAPIHTLLKQLAEAEGSTLQGILARALELYRRHRFLEQVNAGYAALQADTAASSAHAGEAAEWEATLADGLPPERVTPAGGKPATGAAGRNPGESAVPR